MLEASRTQVRAIAERDGEEVRVTPPSVISLLDVLRRRRLDIFLCLAGALALGMGYIAITKPKYAATATLLIDFRRAQLSQTDAAIVDQAAVDSQIELLQSEKIVSAVIKKLDLINDPEFRRIAPDKDSKNPEDADLAMRQATAKLSGGLWVSRVGHSYLVSVTFNSVDPIKAAKIANEIANAYEADQIGAKVQAAKDENAWLGAQVDEMRSRAAQSYRAVQDFKGQHDINPLRDLGVEKDIESLSADAARAKATVATTRAGLERAQRLLESAPKTEMPDGTILRSLADPEIAKDLERFSTIQTQKAQLGADDAQAVSQSQSEAEDLVRRVWTQIAAIAIEDKKDWIIAYAKQQQLDSRLADVRLRDTRARLVQERLRELETAAATSRSLYESYLNQLTHAAQQQPVPASDARVISEATVPLYPTSPKTQLILILAGLAGAAAALAATFLLESLDDVVRTRDQLEAASNLPYLGLVPSIQLLRPRKRGVTPSRGLVPFDFSPLVGANGLRRRIAVRLRRTASDTLRSLRLTANSGLVGDGVVVGVTSALAGEGKSTIAVNLAISGAQAGRRVLLVDCNIRNPTLTLATEDEQTDRPFSAEGAMGGYDLASAISTDQGVHVLPAPQGLGPDGGQLPEAHVLRAIVDAARAEYDFIILDLPAILPLSGLRAVAQMIDSIVLVTRWGKTTSAQIERALAALAAPSRLFGVIFNRVDIKTMRRFEGSRASSYGDQR
jgi:polysaccharide biosynthesis transport protein